MPRYEFTVTLGYPAIIDTQEPRAALWDYMIHSDRLAPEWEEEIDRAREVFDEMNAGIERTLEWSPIPPELAFRGAVARAIARSEGETPAGG